MSIALEAKVGELEKQVERWADAHLRLQVQVSDLMDHLLKANERIATFEQGLVKQGRRNG